MKKTFLLLFTTISIIVSAQKNFEIGVHAGLPANDASENHTFNIALNLAYTKNMNENLKLGITSGLSHFFDNKIGNDFSLVPFATKLKYQFNKLPIFADLDLGYAFSLNNTFKGGFYSFPKVGYAFSKSEIFLGYQMMNSKYKFDYYDVPTETIIKSNTSFNFGSIALGYNFKF